MALPVHHLSEFYPYAKLKPKEIKIDSDTLLKEPMIRFHTDTVQRTAAAIFIWQQVPRWPPLMTTRDRGNNGQSIAAVSRWESEKRPGTGERATGSRRNTRTAQATGGGGGGRRQALQLPDERTGRTNGRREGRQCCICQIVGDGQAVRRPRWVVTYKVRRLHGWTDELYHLFRRPTVRSVKQWDGNRAVWWQKTDDGSLVRSENTEGGNRKSI